jgi:hypothetical protein
MLNIDADGHVLETEISWSHAVITRKRLNEFAEKFSKTKSALAQPTELANLQCLTLEETEFV